MALKAELGAGASNQIYQIHIENAEGGDSSQEIPEAYHDLAEVFLESNANSLPPHREQDHPIDLMKGRTPPFGPIYNLLEKELAEL